MSMHDVKVTDLCEDIKPGVLPLLLLEELKNKSIEPAKKHPKNRFHMLENLNNFLKEIEAEGMKLVGIGADNLVEGDKTAILGVTWTLIRRYEMHGLEDIELLKWARFGAKDLDVPVEDWVFSFNNGNVFAALMDKHAPDHLNFGQCRNLPPAELLKKAFAVADEAFGVPQLLDPADLVGPGASDEKSVILYVAKLRQGILDKQNATARNADLAKQKSADDGENALKAAKLAAEQAAAEDARKAAEDARRAAEEAERARKAAEEAAAAEDACRAAEDARMAAEEAHHARKLAEEAATEDAHRAAEYARRAAEDAERARMAAEKAAAEEAERAAKREAMSIPTDREGRWTLGWSVIEHVNRVRTGPAAYAAHLRARLSGCYEGNAFSPPWQAEKIQMVEGEGGLEELCTQLESMEPLPAVRLLAPLVDAAHDYATKELRDVPKGQMGSPLEARLARWGTWGGAAGEALVYGSKDAESIVVTLLLSDGDVSRKNRKFLLHSTVKVAGFAMAEHPTAGIAGVLSLFSLFAYALDKEVHVTCAGVVSADFEEVLDAIPSDEVREIATSALREGKSVTLDYTIVQLDITVTNTKNGEKHIYNLPLK